MIPLLRLVEYILNSSCVITSTYMWLFKVFINWCCFEWTSSLSWSYRTWVSAWNLRIITTTILKQWWWNIHFKYNNSYFKRNILYLNWESNPEPLPFQAAWKVLHHSNSSTRAALSVCLSVYLSVCLCIFLLKFLITTLLGRIIAIFRRGEVLIINL